MYGDLESVKLLVSNGANVNQRASGRFFLPEDQKNGRTKETTYQGEERIENYLQISLCTIRVKSGKFVQSVNSDSDLVSFIFELLE